MTTLKPCPFCRRPGSRMGTRVKEWTQSGNCYRVNVVGCIPCHVTADEEAWNTRASPWIPVSERLPEDGQRVVYKMDRLIRGKPFGPFLGTFTAEGHGFSSQNANGFLDADDDIEWMGVPT